MGEDLHNIVFEVMAFDGRDVVIASAEGFRASGGTREQAIARLALMVGRAREREYLPQELIAAKEEAKEATALAEQRAGFWGKADRRAREMEGNRNLWRNVVRDALSLNPGDPDPDPDEARRTLLQAFLPGDDRYTAFEDMQQVCTAAHELQRAVDGEQLYAPTLEGVLSAIEGAKEALAERATPVQDREAVLEGLLGVARLRVFKLKTALLSFNPTSTKDGPCFCLRWPDAPAEEQHCTNKKRCGALREALAGEDVRVETLPTGYEVTARFPSVPNVCTKCLAKTVNGYCTSGCDANER